MAQALTYKVRLQRLDQCLQQYAWLWRPQPYKVARPVWTEAQPHLTTALLQLSPDQVAHYSANSAAALRWLDEYVPGIADLNALTAMPSYEHRPLTATDAFLQWDIPGRKWQQIEAFVATLDDVRAPLLEWCGGKGHLGRLLARQFAVPVDTLERDTQLCKEGARLSRRARVTQYFHSVDVLAPENKKYIDGRHALALHACGELHRTLMQRVVASKSPALDLAPCCYHLGIDGTHQPFSSELQLKLNGEDLRLAVTETVTASPGEVRKRDREMAWKLAFNLLRREVTGEDGYRPLKPIDKQWLALEFGAFCQRLAQREGFLFDDAIDWNSFEAQGWQRQHEVVRLSLPRLSVRRALECWLVLDMAAYLQQHGYDVAVGTFCPREVTPRNILLSARSGTAA